MLGDNGNRLEFHFSQLIGLVPFLIFLVAVGILSATKAISMGGMAAYGVAGLILASVFAKDHGQYWEAAITGMLDRSTGILAMIFLVVGIFGKIMAAGKLAGGFVWISHMVGIDGGLFCAFTFVVGAVIGVSSGTSVGTTITMLPVFLPAGVLLGADPVMMVGAILSGAAFGDNLAPISDTTIISASSQTYMGKERSADIGGVVSSRLKYAAVASVAAFALYFVFGGAGAQAKAIQDVMAQHIFPKGLFMVIPPVVVIALAVKGRTIFTALTGGIISGIAVGLIIGIFTVSDIVSVVDGQPKGIIVEGVSSTFENIILFMVVMTMYGILRASGLVDSFVQTLSRRATTPRSSEGVMAFLTLLMSMVTAGITTMTVAIVGPLANSMGKPYKLHPYRRANLVDGLSNTISYFIPWGAYVFLVLAIFPSIKEAYPFLELPGPTGFFFSVFYCWALLVILLGAIVTGFGRVYEGPDCEPVKTPPK